MRKALLVFAAFTLFACSRSSTAPQPTYVIGDLADPPVIHITSVDSLAIHGTAANIDTRLVSVVAWSDDKVYSTPLFYTHVSVRPDGEWRYPVHRTRRVMVLLVNPAIYQLRSPTFEGVVNDSGVLAWDAYSLQE